MVCAMDLSGCSITTLGRIITPFGLASWASFSCIEGTAKQDDQYLKHQIYIGNILSQNVC